MKKLIGHVLIVEGNRFNQDQLKKNLTKIGLSSDVSCDRQQALFMLKNNRGAYDVIITNLNIPNSDSYRLAKETKNNIGQYGYSNIVGYIEEANGTLEYIDCFDAIVQKKITQESIYEGISKFLLKSEPILNSEVPGKIEDNLTDYDNDKKIEIYEVISSSMSDDIKNLENNAGDLRALAHKIKGTSSILGLTEISSLAQDLQNQLDPIKIVNNKKMLIQKMQAVVEEVECLLKAIH